MGPYDHPHLAPHWLLILLLVVKHATPSSTLGSTLRYLRDSCEWTDALGANRLGMTQAELAEMVGVTQKAVSHWEVGRVTPSLLNLMRVAEVLGVPASALLVSPE